MRDDKSWRRSKEVDWPKGGVRKLIGQRVRVRVRVTLLRF